MTVERFRIAMSPEASLVIERGRNAWVSLRQDETWEKWVMIGRAIDQGRREIMRELRTNTPKGKAWSQYFGAWLAENGFDEIDKGARSRLQTCIDNLPAVEAWRATLGLAQRLQLNHPNTVFRRWQAARAAPPADPATPKPGNKKDAEIARLIEELDTAQARLRRIERAAQDVSEGRDWSWHDDPADIAAAMLRLYPDKAKRLGAALQNLAKPAAAKPRRGRSQPAAPAGLA
jgi:hypothetical protein